MSSYVEDGAGKPRGRFTKQEQHLDSIDNLQLLETNDCHKNAVSSILRVAVARWSREKRYVVPNIRLHPRSFMPKQKG